MSIDDNDDAEPRGPPPGGPAPGPPRMGGDNVPGDDSLSNGTVGRSRGMAMDSKSSSLSRKGSLMSVHAGNTMFLVKDCFSFPSSQELSFTPYRQHRERSQFVKRVRPNSFRTYIVLLEDSQKF